MRHVTFDLEPDISVNCHFFAALALGYATYRTAEKRHEQLKRKNPEDYINDQ